MKKGQSCAIEYFLLLCNTVQLKISCYCTILCNWSFLAIVQYCAIENFLVLNNTVQLKISCYCRILRNWKFLAIAQYSVSIIIFDPDLDQHENWAHNQPGAPQGAALYDRRGRTLNSWGKYGQNIQAWYSSEFGLWSNFWHYMVFFYTKQMSRFYKSIKDFFFKLFKSKIK